MVVLVSERERETRAREPQEKKSRGTRKMQASKQDRHTNTAVTVSEFVQPRLQQGILRYRCKASLVSCSNCPLIRHRDEPSYSARSSREIANRSPPIASSTATLEAKQV